MPGSGSLTCTPWWLAEPFFHAEALASRPRGSISVMSGVVKPALNGCAQPRYRSPCQMTEVSRRSAPAGTVKVIFA